MKEAKLRGRFERGQMKAFFFSPPLFNKAFFPFKCESFVEASCVEQGALDLGLEGASPPQSKTTRPALEASPPPELKPNSTSRRSFVLHSLKIPVCDKQQPSLLKAGTYCRRASDVFRQRHYFTSPSSFKAPLYPPTSRASRWFTLNNDRKMSVFDYTKGRGDL